MKSPFPSNKNPPYKMSAAFADRFLWFSLQFWQVFHPRLCLLLRVCYIAVWSVYNHLSLFRYLENRAVLIGLHFSNSPGSVRHTRPLLLQSPIFLFCKLDIDHSISVSCGSIDGIVMEFRSTWYWVRCHHITPRCYTDSVTNKASTKATPISNLRFTAVLS